MSGTAMMEAGLPRGSIIGSYRVVARIGAGGMGVVYAAEHVLLGRAAAIKVLRPEVSHIPGAVQRFFTEARATTTIRHPGIVEIFDFGYTPERLAYIAMEWLDGASLSAVIGRERLGLVATLVIMRRIVGALAAAHGAGVVHRDLKPDNVFLVADPDGGEVPQTKLLDFGIAKLLDGGLAAPRQTATGVVMGTPVYMSPEQCRASPCDHRADLYSLGCVLFEMVAGRPPFDGASMGELLAAHLTQAPVPLCQLAPDTPSSVAHLVARMLAKDPDGRPATAMVVAGELDRIIATLTQHRHSAERATVLAPGLDDIVSVDVRRPSTWLPAPVPTHTSRAVIVASTARRARWRYVLLGGGAAALAFVGALVWQEGAPVAPGAVGAAVSSAATPAGAVIGELAAPSAVPEPASIVAVDAAPMPLVAVDAAPVPLVAVDAARMPLVAVDAAPMPLVAVDAAPPSPLDAGGDRPRPRRRAAKGASSAQPEVIEDLGDRRPPSLDDVIRPDDIVGQ